MRFTHHAVAFLYERDGLDDDELAQIPGGALLYDRLAATIARLQYTLSAMPPRQDTRKSALRSLMSIIDDQLDVEYAPDYLIDLDPESQTFQVGTTSRLLLEFLRKMVLVLYSHASLTNFNVFSRAESEKLNGSIAALQRCLSSLQRRAGGLESFREKGPHQRAICDMASFFLNAAFSDLDKVNISTYNADDVDDDPIWEFGLVWATELSTVIREMADRHGLNRAGDLADLQQSLEQLMPVFRLLIRGRNEGKDSLRRLSQEDVDSLQSLIDEGSDRGRDQPLRVIFWQRSIFLHLIADDSGYRLLRPGRAQANQEQNEDDLIDLLHDYPMGDYDLAHDLLTSLRYRRAANFRDPRNHPPLNDADTRVIEILPWIEYMLEEICEIPHDHPVLNPEMGVHFCVTYFTTFVRAVVSILPSKTTATRSAWFANYLLAT
jgi:hypothetical protein